MRFILAQSRTPTMISDNASDRAHDGRIGTQILEEAWMKGLWSKWWVPVLGCVLAAGRAQAQEASASDSIANRLGELTGRIDGMNEQLQTLQTDTDKLKKFKLSGYIQARWETAENKSDTVRVT